MKKILLSIFLIASALPSDSFCAGADSALQEAGYRWIETSAGRIWAMTYDRIASDPVVAGTAVLATGGAALASPIAVPVVALGSTGFLAYTLKDYAYTYLFSSASTTDPAPSVTPPAPPVTPPAPPVTPPASTTDPVTNSQLAISVGAIGGLLVNEAVGEMIGKKLSKKNALFLGAVSGGTLQALHNSDLLNDKYALIPAAGVASMYIVYRFYKMATMLRRGSHKTC